MLKRTADSFRLLTRETRGQVDTLVDLARRQYTNRPDDLALAFIPTNGDEAHLISVKQFFDNAESYAAALRRCHIGPGDLVILVMEHSEALLYAFWGAVLVGAIPSIFPFLSDKLDPALYFERVRILIGHSGAKAVIASTGFAQALADLLSATHIPVIDEGQLQMENRSPSFATDRNGADIALLQHSSGTTGLQKGVALSHRAILNQVASYADAIHLSAEDRIVSWLPLYHDMGLIAGFVQPIAQGIPLVLLSPFYWVRDPKTLLWAIQRYSGTLCWLPNFAYKFLATRVQPKQIDDLDLSSIRAFINCSEPMQAESHLLFASRFQGYGLNPAALSTCYAMAENTFAVTQGGIDGPVKVDVISRTALADQHRAEPAQGALPQAEMLSCGKAIAHCHVKIVDDAHRVLPERYIGEIAVQSDSMLTGYYRRDDLTAQALVDGWYLTGDYGYLADGELYVTGRKKDLIIVAGRNIYPQDLEAIAETVPGVHAGRVAAFGVPDERLGTETIVIVAEADTEDEDTRAEIGKTIRARIVKETDATVKDVLIVGLKWLHKTSSGKIARGANRDKYLQHVASN
jgi:acyl-CoA synthetase (AMP-forming)/AMP-acid ligase II